MRKTLLLLLVGGILALAAPAQAQTVSVDGGTIIPTTDRSVTDGRTIKCKQTAYGKICYGLVPAPSITQSLGGYIHPWNSAAAAYWGVWNWCHPSSVQIIWINEPTLTWLGAATLDGCWTNTKYIWLNAAYPNVSIGGEGSYRTWCTIVVHEWGHLIGLRFDLYCGAGWVHDCRTPGSIMDYRGIGAIAAGC